ncbi:hypothetical protein CPB84DRAFT_1750124 [Gymnopilus junonius]|uniref:Uncharacterized protein n=1 Tax=Gymnopilus junonius TaxID=109634 RepID=A0A9P5NHN6_GYMJU|nr:hypothetical protein CPB84DRAFT_1750124 [Gymnopilus junonius]
MVKTLLCGTLSLTGTLAALRFSEYLWPSSHFSLPTSEPRPFFLMVALHDEIEGKKDIVRAMPKSAKLPNGHFDTVVVMTTDEAESHGLAGTRIGQLKVIFRLPDLIPAPGAPILAPEAWPKVPLAYVECMACIEFLSPNQRLVGTHQVKFFQ